MNSSKITSLDFLRDFTQGDESQINTYVSIYLNSAQKNVVEIESMMAGGQFEELKKLVHSLKPHFDYMGMKNVRGIAEKIEEKILNGNNENLQDEVDSLTSAIRQSIVELSDRS